MLTLYFEGWYQYRAALDPDPTDEPRGISGPTFAGAGEPDFDGIIRLQNPVAPRYPHENDIGVKVVRVEINGQTIANHPLLGAAVNLLENPTYIERGYILSYMRIPIDPFHLEISKEQLVIARKDLWDVTRPDLTIGEVFRHNVELVPRRQPDVTPQSVLVAEKTGIMDYSAYRRRRREDLIHILEDTRDPVARLALQKRIDNLEKDNQGMTGITLAATQFLGLIATYQFSINGPITLADPDHLLKGQIGTYQEWPVTFWMGGYDVDSLCAFMAGNLSLPFFAEP